MEQHGWRQQRKQLELRRGGGDRRPGDREAAPPHGKKCVCDVDVQQGTCNVPCGR